MTPFIVSALVPLAVVTYWQTVTLIEARQDARRRHQLNIEQRSPRSCAPSRSSARPAGRQPRPAASRPMVTGWGWE